MRIPPLIPWFESSTEAAEFLRRGYWRFYFPRFPLFALFLWVSIPASKSIKAHSASICLSWVDLAWNLVGATLVSFFVWWGYKTTYRGAQ